MCYKVVAIDVVSEMVVRSYTSLSRAGFLDVGRIISYTVCRRFRSYRARGGDTGLTLANEKA